MSARTRITSSITSPRPTGIGHTHLYNRDPPKSNITRTASKGSLRTISDRHLKKTYEPPVYKSRAFRSRRNYELKGAKTNEELKVEVQSQDLLMSDEMMKT